MSADETRDALAAVLAEHGPSMRIGVNACLCGATIHDESQYRGHVAAALLASGLIPEGTTTVEWGVRLCDGRAVVPLAGGDEDEAQEWAREIPGAVANSRTRSSYPDRVTDWEPR